MFNFLRKNKSKFKAELENVQDTNGLLRIGMVVFHQALKNKMGLTQQDVDDMSMNRTEFRCGEYIISSRSFSFSPGWYTLLYAYPTSIGEPGWSNRVTGPVNPDRFYYIPGGTTTIFLPKPDEQERILQSIEENEE